MGWVQAAGAVVRRGEPPRRQLEVLVRASVGLCLGWVLCVLALSVARGGGRWLAVARDRSVAT